jgi:2',3'-cyclic-nucleotide 2'-phosphodiesterase (5'-nucleotidase family)
MQGVTALAHRGCDRYCVRVILGVRPATPVRRAIVAALMLAGSARFRLVRAAVAEPPAPAEPAPPPPLEIWYHADLDGRLATFRCGRAGPAEPDYGAIVAIITAARAAALARAQPAPVVLLGGNQAGPDLFAATLLARGATGARALAALLARGGYDAVALGHHELALESAQLDLVVPALAAAGLAVVASNLRCDAASRPACAAIRKELLIQRGSERIGILATISPSVLSGIPAGRMEGLTLEPALEAIRAGVARLRARGATRIVLLAQGPRGAGSLDEVDLLQRSLAGLGAGAAPDLVLAGGLSDDESGRALRLLRRDNAPPVVGAPAGMAGLSRVLLSPDDVRVEARAPGAEDDPATRALLAQEQGDTCTAIMEPLMPAAPRAPISRDEFARYVLEAMRRRAGAEIALVNRDFVKRAPFPLAGRITRGDLERALPYRAVLGAARVPGPLIESVLGSALNHPKLDVVGLARAGGGLQVNGRGLDKARAYRVTTIGFVADGGDGILARHALPWRALDGTPDVRDVVASFLRAAANATESGAAVALPAPPPLDAPATFGPRAAQRALWVGLADVGFDLNDTSVRNPAGYGDAQLTRAQQTSLKGQVTLVAQVRKPVHEADGRVDVQYGWSRSQPPGAPAASGETADLVTAIAQYAYRGLRDVRRIPKPAIPDPYARAWLESELTRPEVTATQPRDYRHLQLTTTLGLQFTLNPRLKLRGGVGAQSELAARGEPGRWHPLVEAGATLDPTAIATFGPLAVKLEGSASYDLVDHGVTDGRLHQLRSTAKISVPLLPHLFITFGVDVFAVERGGQRWAASYDSTVGLRAHTDFARQDL